MKSKVKNLKKVKKNKLGFLNDAHGKSSLKRLWMNIFFLAALLLSAVTLIVSYFKAFPDPSLIRDVLFGLLGAGLTLAAATVPENIKKWGMHGNETV